MSGQGEKCGQMISVAVASILKNIPDMVFVKDTELIYAAASLSFANLVGFEHPEELVGKRDADLFGDEDLVRRYTEDDGVLLATGQPMQAYIEPFEKKDGTRGYCQTSKFPLYDEASNLIGLYGISRDVTIEYKAKLDYEQELRSLFSLPPNALRAALFDITNWRVVDTRVNKDENDGIVGFGSVEAFLQDSIHAITDDENARMFYRTVSGESLQSMYESGKRQLSLEYQRNFWGKGIRWVRNDLHLMSDPVNGNLCVMSILIDITQEKQATYALLHAAERDALTGVYNRETTMSKIRDFLSGEGADGTHLLFMVDIDNFKTVNDTFGHQTGDETLVRIAGAIRKVFRATDIVGRIGGDEFFALMKNAENLSAARRRGMELVEALQYDYVEGNAHVALSGSVGISRYAGDGKTLEALYKEADDALYRAKQEGKNRFVFADETAPIWKEKDMMSTINLRTLLANMEAVMFQTEIGSDGDIRVTYSSHSLFSASEQVLTSSGARGEDIWSVILPEDLALLKGAIYEASANHLVLDCSCRVKNAGGQIEWRHIRGTRLPDQGDDICRMIHVATDITAQKQIEAQLREKNSIIDFAMSNSDVNLWYFDYQTTECQLTESCQKAHEMPGITVLKNFPDCLIEMGYIHEDCAALLRERYEHLRKTGESTEFDVWFRKADGMGWWCEREMISPLFDADNQVTRVIGIGRNVTAEKVLEEKYEAFGAYRRLTEKNIRVSFRMNLTTGRFGEFVGGMEKVKHLYTADTVDIFLARVRERIAAANEAVSFSEEFSRERLLEAFARGEMLRAAEFLYHIEDERIIWLRIIVEMMQSPVTGEVEALFYSSDIDHEKNMQLLVDKLLEDDYEFLGLIDVSTGLLMVFGGGADVPGTARNGHRYEDEMKRVFRGLILDEYYDEGVRIMSCNHVIEELKTKKYYVCSFPARAFAHTREGRKQWKFAYLDDSRAKILMARIDITRIYTVEYDALTGLYNRDTFYRRVGEILKANPDERFILVRFDIDRFKAYNDIYGTQAGDRLLAAIGRAARLKTWPKLSISGHLEGDHFVALIPAEKFDHEVWGKHHAQWLASLAEGCRLTSSVGIYEITDPTLEVSLMCDRALLALHTVKDSYTNKVAWYDGSLREKLMNEQAMGEEMEQALQKEQFILFFQPLIDYRSGLLIGAEALVRWRHPVRGLIPPGEFIPLFERNGLILKLDAFVWEKSCQYLRRWLDMGKTPLPVSVNVSRCDLYDSAICEKLQALIKKYQLPFSLLKLEITESAYMEDSRQLIDVVEQLRCIGFVVEMDDFGTGYSSLNMLKDMPVDTLKLDMRFISESESDMRAATVLSSIIGMAHQLGLSVIAEGVETKAQADTLKELNCNKMQGYYFSRPMSLQDFEKMLCDEKK